MFIPVTRDPVPYVLIDDRGNAVQTVWHMRPMTAEETTAYRARWAKENAGEGSPEARARECIRVDREELFKLLNEGNGIDNALVVDDHVAGDAINGVVAQMDFGVLQECLSAAQVMSRLKAGAKK